MSWKYALCSSIGTSHVAAGVSCQDSSGCTIYTDKNGESVAVAVVSDGAGSVSRSDFGSSLCVWSFQQFVGQLLDEGHTASSIGRAEIEDWVIAFNRLIGWLARLDRLSPREYVCTICAAIVSGGSSVWVQVGDGLMVARSSDEDNFCWVFEPDNGEYDNETFFLGTGNLEDHLLVQSTADGNASRSHTIEFALMTDGVQKLAFDQKTLEVLPKFMDPLFRPVRNARYSGEIKSVSADLSKLFESPMVNSRVDDDKSIILVTSEFRNMSSP